jgi:hypothetical protein
MDTEILRYVQHEKGLPVWLLTLTFRKAWLH